MFYESDTKRTFQSHLTQQFYCQMGLRLLIGKGLPHISIFSNWTISLHALFFKNSIKHFSHFTIGRPNNKNQPFWGEMIPPVPLV